MSELGAIRRKRFSLKSAMASARRPRIAHIVLAAVLWGLVIAEIVILTPSLFIWQREQAALVETNTLALVKANVDQTSFPTVEQTVRIGERLLRFSSVRGGSVFNAVGEKVAAFGEVPSLTISTIRNENITQLRTSDRTRLDVFFPREATGLANAVVLRIDSSRLDSEVFQRALDKGQSIFLSATVAALAVIVILSFGIVRPLVRLRDAATAATDNPDRAEQYRLKWKRGDELGEASRAFDMLLTSLSVTYQEDLAAGQLAVEKSHFGILSYDRNGRLTAANTASLRLFGVASVDQLVALGQNRIRVTTPTGSMDVSPVSLLSNGDLTQSAMVITNNGLKRCQLSGVVIRKRNGQVLRHVITLVDMTKQASYTEALENEVGRWQAEAAQSRKSMAEMRAMFESCLVLLQATSNVAVAAEVEGKEIPIALPDRIVNLWYSDAQKAGLVEGRLEHGFLPQVRGHSEDIEAVFRQALTLVYTRSSSERAALRVSAETLTYQMATFTVSEIPSGSNQKSKTGAVIAAGRSIALAGLGIALRRVGGRLDDSDFGGNGIMFTMPAVVTAKKPREEAAAPRIRMSARG